MNTTPVPTDTFVVTCTWNGKPDEYRIADEKNANGMYDYLKEHKADNVVLWTAYAYNAHT